MNHWQKFSVQANNIVFLDYKRTANKLMNNYLK